MNLKKYNLETKIKPKPIILTLEEKDIYVDLIQKSNSVDPVIRRGYYRFLNELNSATYVIEEELSNKVARIGSVVSIETAFGRKDLLELVMPEYGDLSKNKLSIMSPLGISLLGYEEGDTILWEILKGDDVITLIKVDNLSKETNTKKTTKSHQ